MADLNDKDQQNSKTMSSEISAAVTNNQAIKPTSTKQKIIKRKVVKKIRRRILKKKLPDGTVVQEVIEETIEPDKVQVIESQADNNKIEIENENNVPTEKKFKIDENQNQENDSESKNTQNNTVTDKSVTKITSHNEYNEKNDHQKTATATELNGKTDETRAFSLDSGGISLATSDDVPVEEIEEEEEEEEEIEEIQEVIQDSSSQDSKVTDNNNKPEDSIDPGGQLSKDQIHQILAQKIDAFVSNDNNDDDETKRSKSLDQVTLTESEVDLPRSETDSVVIELSSGSDNETDKTITENHSHDNQKPDYFYERKGKDANGNSVTFSINSSTIVAAAAEPAKNKKFEAVLEIPKETTCEHLPITLLDLLLERYIDQEWLKKRNVKSKEAYMLLDIDPKDKKPSKFLKRKEKFEDQYNVDLHDEDGKKIIFTSYISRVQCFSAKNHFDRVLNKDILPGIRKYCAKIEDISLPRVRLLPRYKDCGLQPEDLLLFFNKFDNYFGQWFGFGTKNMVKDLTISRKSTTKDPNLFLFPPKILRPRKKIRSQIRNHQPQIPLIPRQTPYHQQTRKPQHSVHERYESRWPEKNLGELY